METPLREWCVSCQPLHSMMHEHLKIAGSEVLVDVPQVPLSLNFSNSSQERGWESVAGF